MTCVPAGPTTGWDLESEELKEWTCEMSWKAEWGSSKWGWEVNDDGLPS